MSFLEEIEEFLLQLRESYGYILPVDRLAACLACVRHITDVEEVLYRLQSMVCTSQEQVETFQSLFAQRFLKMVPRLPGEEDRRGDSGAGRDTDRVRKQLQQAVDRSSVRLKEASREEESARREMENIREKMRSAQDAYEKEVASPPDLTLSQVSGMRDRLVPNREEPRLRKALEALEAAYDGMDRAGVATEKFRTRTGKALASPDYSALLDQLAADLMETARETRSKRNMEGFSATLKAVSAVKALKTAASRSIPSGEKKEYNSAARALKAHNRILDRHAEQMGELQRDLQYAQSVHSRALSHQQQMERQKTQADRKLEQFRQEQEHKRQLEQQRAAQEGNMLLIKERAISHRPLFVNGIHAVQTTDEQAELMETDLKRMSTAEREQVLTFIRTNARAFRQTLRRRQTAVHHRRVDIRATVRAAGRTNGEPLVIRYREPVKSHARVVILTDISGSCRNASTLALYFMGLMDQAFPGGCRKFAFVNSLNPVDHCFRDCTPDEGVQAVLSSIPTRGVYSDYGATIHALRQEYGGTFHRDTTVIILGDARNNRRRSAAEDLKYIADRCCRMYWLNTDDVDRWNQGDSIIGEYEKCGAQVHHVATVGQLLEFLSGVTLARGAG